MHLTCWEISAKIQATTGKEHCSSLTFGCRLSMTHPTFAGKSAILLGGMGNSEKGEAWQTILNMGISIIMLIMVCVLEKVEDKVKLN